MWSLQDLLKMIKSSIYTKTTSPQEFIKYVCHHSLKCWWCIFFSIPLATLEFQTNPPRCRKCCLLHIFLCHWHLPISTGQLCPCKSLQSLIDSWNWKSIWFNHLIQFFCNQLSTSLVPSFFFYQHHWSCPF